MKTLNVFFTIIKKNMTAILIYFGIFVALSLIFSSTAKESKQGLFEYSSVEIGIIDYDNTKTSKALTDYLSSIHTLKDVPSDKEALIEELYFVNIEYVLEIPKNFEQTILSGNRPEPLLTNYKIPDTTSDVFINAQVDQYLGVLSLYIKSGDSLDECINQTKITMDKESTVTFFEKAKKSVSSMYYYFMYFPYILLSILIVGLGPILIRFRQKELRTRIYSSPLPPRKFTFFLALGSVLFSIVIFSLFMVFSMILYHESFFTANGLLHCINGLFCLLVSLGITLIVSNFVRNQNSVHMICNVLGLGLSFLGGVFVPIEFLPKSLLKVSQFLPSYWYVKGADAAEKYTSVASNLMDYYKAIGLQACFILCFFGVALLTSRYRAAE